MFSFRGATNTLVLSLTLLASGASHALVEMGESEMQDVSGAGLAFGLEDFRFQMAPTSYIEQVGSEPPATTSFNRGDLRWYGLTISNGAGVGQNWQGGACSSAGLNNMACPMSAQGITNFANHDNPYVLRVFNYTRVGLNGAGTDWVGAPVSNGASAGGIERTVLELLGPSNTDTFRWAFWGDIQASTTDPSTNMIGSLQNQNIILGKPASPLKPPSLPASSFSNAANRNNMEGPVLQLFQNQGDSSLGILFHSRLSGDYRFSVNRTTALADGVLNAAVPTFTEEEGLYFTGVNTYLPLGALHYQSIILDDISTGSTGGVGNGNFVIELTRLQNDSNVYLDAYSVTSGNGYTRTNRNDRYYQTHGYVEWGNQFPTCGGTNCLSGTGVSAARFAGPGTAVAHTITLPERVVNSQNFPDDPNGHCGGNDCDFWRGDNFPNSVYSQNGNPVTDGTDVAIAVTVNRAAGGNVAATSTRAQIAQAGGISFISRNSASTWTVMNNPNDKQRFIRDMDRRDDVMNARTDPNSYGCGFLCTRRELFADLTPDQTALQNAANNLNPTGYSSVIRVNAINLGTARVEGLLMNHLKITSLGAN
ncbi:MAG: hypothetical protein P1U67_04030 [Alcanivoracaceae bacterium]|nr:hypothetical protein [Alcanivoracaceae bacterium]